MSRRAMVFIDGFNLYHSLDNVSSYKKYKWLNLWSLSEKLLFPGEMLVSVFYFTAYTDWNPDRKLRHQEYVTINEYFGCSTILGNFQKKTRYSAVPCGKPCQPASPSSTHVKCCRKPFETHEEKKTDVNIAVHIIKNCVQGKCNAVYLLSGDNDLVPGLETAKELCPQIRFRVLLPINARAKTLMSVCKANGFKYVRIKEQHLMASQFPDPLVVGGKTYTKPKHWV